VDPELAVQEDVAAFVRRLDSTWQTARVALATSVASSVAQANKHRRPFPTFPVGSRVLVRMMPKRRNMLFPIGQLSPKWAGPYVVKKIGRGFHLSPGPPWGGFLEPYVLV